jgi:hypothetical protein
MQFLHLLSFLCPNILFSILFSNALNLCSWCGRPKFHTHKSPTATNCRLACITFHELYL